MLIRPLENILILDTETGGLKPSEHALLEIGVIFYNLPTKSILLKTSGLLYAESNPVFHINKIDIESCKKVNPDIEHYFLSLIVKAMRKSDLIIAHNASFDKGFVEEHVAQDYTLIWLCTKNDIKWPISRLKLENISSYYGIDYTAAHRALDDCEILLKCLLKLPDFEEQLNIIYNRKKGV